MRIRKGRGAKEKTKGESLCLHDDDDDDDDDDLYIGDDRSIHSRYRKYLLLPRICGTRYTSAHELKFQHSPCNNSPTSNNGDQASSLS